MTDLPVFTLEDLERMPRAEVPEWNNDTAVALGLTAVAVMRERDGGVVVPFGHLGARHPLEIFQGEHGEVGHGSKPTPGAVR